MLAYQEASRDDRPTGQGTVGADENSWSMKGFPERYDRCDRWRGRDSGPLRLPWPVFGASPSSRKYCRYALRMRSTPCSESRARWTRPVVSRKPLSRATSLSRGPHTAASAPWTGKGARGPLGRLRAHHCSLSTRNYSRPREAVRGVIAQGVAHYGCQSITLRDPSHLLRAGHSLAHRG